VNLVVVVGPECESPSIEFDSVRLSGWRYVLLLDSAPSSVACERAPKPAKEDNVEYVPDAENVCVIVSDGARIPVYVQLAVTVPLVSLWLLASVLKSGKSSKLGMPASDGTKTVKRLPELDPT
jgi:hypothetical protein